MMTDDDSGAATAILRSGHVAETKPEIREVSTAQSGLVHSASARQLSKLGLTLTILWLLFLAIMAFAGWEMLFKMEPNEFGDMLAGVFAPLAFLWLVLGFFQQGEELRASVAALELQGRELQNSVNQQRELVKVSREQMESEMAAARQSVKNFRDAERGILTGRVASGQRLDSGLIRISCHMQNRGKNKVKVIEATGVWQESIAITDELPIHVQSPTWIDPDKFGWVSFPVSSDEERGALDEVVGRVTYQDQFGDRHQCWVAGKLTGLRDPDELERITGDSATHQFQDMTDALPDHETH